MSKCAEIQKSWMVKTANAIDHNTWDPGPGPGAPGAGSGPQLPWSMAFVYAACFYTWVFNTWFLGRPEIVVLGESGGPSGPKNHSSIVVNGAGYFHHARILNLSAARHRRL